MAKKEKQNPDEIKKLYIVLELPQGEIEAIMDKIKQHKRFKYYWITEDEQTRNSPVGN